MPDDLLSRAGIVEVIAPGDVTIFCAEHAEAIRVLGRRVVGDIIEIGNRLIAVRERLPHGEWLPWLDREFGWSEQTARNFMAAADAFGKSPTVVDLPIDAGALYLLAGPSVPPAAREAAIELAETGERITKADAEKMVAERSRQGIERALAEYQAAEAKRLDAAIAAATTALANDKATLKRTIAELRAKQSKPNVEALCKAIERSLGVRSLSPDQYRLLAQLLGTSIAVGKAAYGPVPKEKILENEENLRIASKITEALETLAGAPPAEAVAIATWPVQRKQHRRVLDTAIAWLTSYRAILGAEE